MNLVEYYKANMPQDWQPILNETGFVRLLLDIQALYKDNKDLIPRNSELLLRPFIDCPLKNLKVIVLGPGTESSDVFFDGVLFSSRKIPNRNTINVFKELQRKRGFHLDWADLSMKPWSEQGVLLLSSLPIAGLSGAGLLADAFSVFYDKFIRYMQARTSILYIFIDCPKIAINYNVASEIFRIDTILGSGFFDRINEILLEKMDVKPIDWMKIIKERPLYDIRRIMLQSSKFGKTGE
ncbi:MAG: hypothetical protein QXL01_00055 [Thermoplasmatales archaeon]